MALQGWDLLDPVEGSWQEDVGHRAVARAGKWRGVVGASVRYVQVEQEAVQQTNLHPFVEKKTLPGPREYLSMISKRVSRYPYKYEINKLYVPSSSSRMLPGIMDNSELR